MLCRVPAVPQECPDDRCNNLHDRRQRMHQAEINGCLLMEHHCQNERGQ